MNQLYRKYCWYKLAYSQLLLLHEIYIKNKVESEVKKIRIKNTTYTT